MSVPDVRITLGDQDLTAKLTDRLLSLTIEDASGEESDALELVLDDRDGRIETPRKGVTLTVSIGYRDALVGMGAFVVDEVEFEGGGDGDRLHIRAKAADMRDSLKTPKTRAWRNTTILAVISRIAGEHGLAPAVAAELGGKVIAHRDQTRESDLHFVTRLGRDFGAVGAPKGGKLVFVPEGRAQSASGKPLAAVVLKRADLMAWRLTMADRSSHGTVRARWRDVAAAKTKFVSVGGGDPTTTLRKVYRDEASAKEAAGAKARRLAKGSAEVEVKLVGQATLAAQTPFEIEGLRSDFAGRWIAEKVTHEIDFGGGGYTTRMTGNREGKKAA